MQRTPWWTTWNPRQAVVYGGASGFVTLQIADALKGMTSLTETPTNLGVAVLAGLVCGLIVRWKQANEG